MFARLKRLAGEPLVHFLLIGAGIYGVFGVLSAGEAGNDERTVTVASGEIQALTDQWFRSMSRPPTEDELDGIIRRHVRIQILYREALAMGMDKGDVVIKRRLAQKVELLAQGLMTPEEPREEELIAWYAENSDRFKQPDLYTITQIFFDPDKRGATTLDDVKAAIDKLNALDRLPPDFSDYGDRLMLESYYANVSTMELGKLFGTAFAEQIVELELGVWQGPVLSGYGAHLVRVSDAVLVPLPAFDDVKQQITEEWMARQVNELSERFIENLVSRYEVIIEEADVQALIPGNGVSQ
jgi:peptidyl-prolyl cis-trans isomerase C